MRPGSVPAGIAAGGLALSLEGEELTLWDAVRGHRLLIVPLAGCGRPTLDGTPVDLRVTAIEHAADRLVVRQAGDGVSVETAWIAAGDHLELECAFTATRAAGLERLELLPAGTALNCYEVLNYRNRHFCPSARPELLLGGAGCATDTYSTDWQFAPHPSMLVLGRGADNLLVGALDLPTAFGLHLQVAEHRVRTWHLDYGGAGHGLALPAGATFAAPRFALLLARKASPEEAIRRWTRLLVDQGEIPDPAATVRHAWHGEPLYCTWIDQCARGALVPPAALQDQAAAVDPAIRVLDEAMVREALAVIRRERLPFRTILIDDGWAVARGDWRAHPQRFPDLRRLIDDIHAAGMKVILWWAWPEIATGVEPDPRFLIAGGRRNRHGSPMYDMSSPVTQREWLEPLIRRMLSSEAGCYDADGLKTDFMADKVHPDMPPHDPAWRGEENWFDRFYHLLHGLMRRHKPDACHIGCSGHPWLADAIDVNRTFDVASSDVREHACRGAMLEATCPGTTVALDLHNYVEHLDAWAELGRRHGWAVEVGNILMQRRDRFATWEPADAAYYAHLRAALAGQIRAGRPAAASARRSARRSPSSRRTARS